MKLHPSSWIAIGVTSLVGIVAFAWPFVTTANASVASSPWVFMVLVPLLVLLVFAQLADGDLDAKRVAVLGVLAAVVSALRPLGGGAAGIEPIWFVIVLAGRALGPGFGFSLGSISMLASAFLTGGVGPWLPFQMLAAGWVGLGAGLLPAATGKRELAITAIYGGVVAITYGLVMNLWFWPYLGALPDSVSFDAAAGPAANFSHWLTFSITTSLGFDIPRAVITVLLILLTGRPVLFTLRRITRKAAFDVPVVFADSAN